MATKTNTPPVKTKTPDADAPKQKKERLPMLSYSVFGKLPAGSSLSVAGIIRKVKTKVSNTGEAQVFIGEFAYSVDGGAPINATRAILPANLAAAFPAEIEKPQVFSMTYKDKVGAFVRTPSNFTVSVLLP